MISNENEYPELTRGCPHCSDRHICKVPDGASSSTGDAARCTGLTATWCPVHGNCRCPSGDEALDAPACPLHATGSDHPRAAPAPSRETDPDEREEIDAGARMLPCGCVRCVCTVEPEEGEDPRCYGCGGREAEACQRSRLAGGPRHVSPGRPEAAKLDRAIERVAKARSALASPGSPRAAPPMRCDDCAHHGGCEREKVRASVPGWREKVDDCDARTPCANPAHPFCDEAAAGGCTPEPTLTIYLSGPRCPRCGLAPTRWDSRKQPPVYLTAVPVVVEGAIDVWGCTNGHQWTRQDLAAPVPTPDAPTNAEKENDK